MKFSIITPTYNSTATITNCLNSIYSQENVFIEHIIIDGASTDDTINKINEIKYNERVIISEPDQGIYDAMNKGLSIASGDIVGILNSDDMYYSKNVLQKINECFKDNDVDCVHGDLVYVDAKDTSKELRYWKSKDFSKRDFLNGAHPAHPTFFVKKSIYDKLGKFDTEYSIASDYDLMFRFLYKNNIKSKYIKSLLVKMRVGGVSNRNLRNIIISNIECRNSWIKNGFKPPTLFIFRKPLRKLKQYWEK